MEDVFAITDLTNLILQDLSYNDVKILKICCVSFFNGINNKQIDEFWKLKLQTEYKSFKLYPTFNKGYYLQIYKCLLFTNYNALRVSSLSGDINTFVSLLESGLYTHKRSNAIYSIVLACVTDNLAKLNFFINNWKYTYLPYDIDLIRLALTGTKSYKCLVFFLLNGLIISQVFDKFYIDKKNIIRYRLENLFPDRQHQKSLMEKLIQLITDFEMFKFIDARTADALFFEKILQNKHFDVSKNSNLINDIFKTQNPRILGVIMKDPRIQIPSFILSNFGDNKPHISKILLEDFRCDVDKMLGMDSRINHLLKYEHDKRNANFITIRQLMFIILQSEKNINDMIKKCKQFLTFKKLDKTAFKIITSKSFSDTNYEKNNIPHYLNVFNFHLLQLKDIEQTDIQSCLPLCI